MATIKLGGNPVNTSGDLPKNGDKAPDFVLTKSDLTDVSLKDFAGKRKILNIVPSLDTGVCAASARRFNQEAAKLANVVILTISNDLPFAMKRFCATEGIERAVSFSAFRTDFAEKFGVKITQGGMSGLLSRAVVILDEQGKVVYTEQVPEITTEPNYDAAMAKL